MVRSTYICIIILTYSLIANGQYQSNLRYKSIPFSQNISIDSLSIVPGSLTIAQNNKPLADSLFTIDYMTAKINFTSSTYNYAETFNINYRVFPVNFSATYPSYQSNVFIHPDSNKFHLNNFAKTTTYNKPQEKHTLVVNGNISRGVSVGNNQNMVVTSNLNLQLSGKLSENLNIEAYLSDRNIPLQPSGYTQQLQEFDQIYIRLYDSVTQAQMGDVNIKGSNSYFLKFNKNLMGGEMTHVHKKTGAYKNTTQLSAAVAKGNFQRMEISGIEAVQGPYKLTGTNNETYIFILAGSENIYLDGQILERGENADYVIDYNTAELIFTSKHIITKDSRIIAEYEYSDKNYNRFVLYAQNNLQFEKGSFAVQYFNESDAKNQPVNLLLGENELNTLANAGDDPLKAIVKQVDSIGFNKNRVLYKLIDTAVNSVLYDSVLVHSYNADSAFYTASFTLVGENKGNYNIINSVANGKVYQWIAPINNIPQGNYEPLQLLIAPVKHQVIIGNLNLKPSKNTNIDVEIALSEHDKNTFSEIDNGDNKGLALRLKAQQKFPMDRTAFVVQTNYETVSKSFKGIEKFRNAEFSRDWNLSDAINENEHLVEGKFSLKQKKNEWIGYKSQFLKREQSFEGFRNTVSSDFEFHNFKFAALASLLNTSEEIKNTQFYRHNISLSKSFGIFNLGIDQSIENNEQNNSANDSLLAYSNGYSEWQSRFFLPDTLKRNFSLAYKYRNSYLPYNNEMSLATTSQDISGIINLKKSQTNNLSATITWRDLQVNNTNLTQNLKNESNLLGRIDHSLRLKKMWLTAFTFYEIGTGMETEKEYSYLEVAPGQGTYIWEDYNNNDIPELNEFEISPFPEEANFIRIYTPTNNYIKVYALKLNETIKIDPRKIWRNEKGMKKFVARFSNTATLQINQKHRNNSVESRLNPFSLNLNDTLLINNSFNYRNVFSFNRADPKFGAEYIFQHQNQKRLITNGFESSSIQRNQIKIRWNILSSLLLLNNSTIENKELNSEYFSEKNYNIENLQNKITLQWQPYTILRFAINYDLKHKENVIGTEICMMQTLGPEVKYSWPAKGYITLKTNLINVDYNAVNTNAISYQMMDGHRNGENYTWTVNISRLINKFIQLNFSYNGRKPSQATVIHTGQISVSAVF